MKERSKQILLSVIGILVLMMITVGVTYAVFTYTKLGTTDNIITTGTLKFLYTENSGVGAGISITDALPVSDSVGKNYSTDGYVFDFKVESTNTSNEFINYEVTLRKDSSSSLDEDVVKVYLTDTTSGIEKEILKPTLFNRLTDTSIDVEDNIEKTLYKGTVSGGEGNYLKNFRLRMWIDENTDFESGSYSGETFNVTVNVYANASVVSEASRYKEAILNGTDPVLSSNLVPVVISSDGTVNKADTSVEWYRYEDKEWANAVILKDETVLYKNNEVIPESNIESYFVWIPRYKYKIFDEGSYSSLTTIESKEQVIDVIFENKETTPSNGTTVGDYLTHPAFTSFESNGMWVGKFETGYDGAASATAAQVNSVNTSKIVIKPNVYSWRNMTVGNMFKNSYDYMRELDSHMMKNTEWGAVAYLQHSKYGSATSVRVNNNSSYITGYASTEEPTKGFSNSSIVGNRFEATALGVDGTYTVNYLNPNSVVASTTGNITGIYDMSGGSQEYVMGYSAGASLNGGSSGITSLYSDFFNDSTYTKYWDKYTSTVATQYSNRILGDATGELGPFGSQKDPDGTTRANSSWYNNYSYFVVASTPWSIRGGYFRQGVKAGIFAFSYGNGTLNSFAFRIVLTPLSKN